MSQINKYQNGKIYKLVADVEDCIPYFGSTVEKYLSNRKGGHRKHYKKWKNGKGPYITSFDLFEKYGIDKVKIILVESCNFETNEQLRAREQYYIDNNKCVNKMKAFATIEKKKEVKKQCFDRFIENNKNYYKDYNLQHQEEISLKSKQYREDNKQTICENRKIMTHCDVCDSDIRKCGILVHNQTTKHLNNLKQI